MAIVAYRQLQSSYRSDTAHGKGRCGCLHISSGLDVWQTLQMAQASLHMAANLQGMQETQQLHKHWSLLPSIKLGGVETQ